MLSLELSSSATASSVVTSAHFGANAIYKVNTSFGEVGQSFVDAAKELGVRHIRYPAGQGDRADVSTDGTEWLNVVKMEDGELRPELTRFLDWAAETGVKVTLVIPTKLTDVAGYAAFAEEIKAFAAAVANEYGDVVEAFEIGNEYWEMGETAYGQKADMAIRALAEGLEAGGFPGEDQPAILVQMGTPNAGSEFYADAEGMQGLSFQQRADMSNQQIIDQLGDAARAALDGVVDHSYYVQTRQLFTDGSDEVNFIDRDFAVWQNNFAQDLELHITEWNVKISNLVENGIRSASTLIHLFDNLLQVGADSASIWALQHNTATDLAGNSGDSMILDGDGRVVSTIRGAVFDMMEDSIVGLARQDVEAIGAAELDITAFADDRKTVIYVASRSFEMAEVDLDFGALASAGSVEGLKLGYDPRHSNGFHYDTDAGAWVAAMSVDLDKDGTDDYFVNEHDVRAKFEEFSQSELMADGGISFDLKPFEVMQLTFVQPLRIVGGDGNDSLQGTSGNDAMHGQLGRDELDGRGGDDAMKGGNGHDRLLGGSGDDTAEGNRGTDMIRSGKGDDVALGGGGHDRLVGGSGHDDLSGGGGNDSLDGGNGNDTLNGGAGNDELNGGKGNDALTGGGGADIFVFNAGHDRIADYAAEDAILVSSRLSGAGTDMQDILDTAEINARGNLVLTFDAENSIELVGVGDAQTLDIAFA